MPSLRTEITEIITGAATLGRESLAEILAGPAPSELKNVPAAVWQRLCDAQSDPSHRGDFESAWANGLAFLNSSDALRGRPPLRVEWKGPHHQPGYEFLPIDLRLDHVYLVSCKYLSKLLANPSPENLFLHAMAQRGSSQSDWYTTVAARQYGEFYRAVRAYLGPSWALPDDVGALTAIERQQLGEVLKGAWPEALQEMARRFASEISRETVAIWAARLPTKASRETLLWRMLRLGSAPYFVLGTSSQSSLRLRVDTPWDWRQRYMLLDFDFAPKESVQPVVAWQAVVDDRETGAQRVVIGHVEIRWSHGRFCGYPEAKVYLDTPHGEVAGYTALDEAPGSHVQLTGDVDARAGRANARLFT